MKDFEKYVKFSYNKWEIRNTKKTRALPKHVRQEIIQGCQRRNDRQKLNHSGIDPLTLPLEKRLEYHRNKIKREIKNFILQNYRCASGRWAGGETFVQIHFDCDSPHVGGESNRVWSSNGKWSGLNATYIIKLPQNWWKEIWKKELAFLDGMLTLDAKELEPDVWEALWAIQGRGFSLNIESGVIAKFGEIYIHAKNLKGAKQIYRNRLKAEKTARRLKELKELDVPKLKEIYGNVTVTIPDAIKAGNCETGVKHWVATHFPNRKKATVNEILNEDTQWRVIRACYVAIAKRI